MSSVVLWMFRKQYLAIAVQYYSQVVLVMSKKLSFPYDVALHEGCLSPSCITRSRFRRQLPRNFRPSHQSPGRVGQYRPSERSVGYSGSPLGVRRRRQITSDRYDVRTTANWAKSDYERTYHRTRRRRRLYLLNGLRQFAAVANNSYRICWASASDWPQRDAPTATTFVLSQRRSLTFNPQRS